MFRSCWILAAAFAAIHGLAGQAAAAEEFKAAPGQHFTFDLDTAPGEFSNWLHDDLGSISALVGTFSVPQIRKHPRWHPYFVIGLLTSDGRFAIALEANHWKPPLVAYVESKSKAGKPIGLTFPVGKKIDIALNWADASRLVIRLDNADPIMVPVSGSLTGVAVSASTGELKFHSLTLGQFGP
jgi:hypothetical protein